MMYEYIFLFIYLIVVFFLILLIPFASTVIVNQQNYKEKITSYECGFEPMEAYIQQFDVRYYLIAVLFLIFDLELAYLMPWIVTLGNGTTYYSFFSMLVFFFLIVLAFYYEWLKGGLEWD